MILYVLQENKKYFARDVALRQIPLFVIALGITSVDPTKFDLLFERFISSARNEPPDIDVDFEHERREEVINIFIRNMAVTGQLLLPPLHSNIKKERSVMWEKRWVYQLIQSTGFQAPSGNLLMNGLKEND